MQSGLSLSPLVLNAVRSLIAAILASIYIQVRHQKSQIQTSFANGLIWKYLLLGTTSNTGSWCRDVTYTNSYSISSADFDNYCAVRGEAKKTTRSSVRTRYFS